MSAITVRGLAVALGTGPWALRDLDLDVAPGEVVVVQGPSGSGKSTLLRSLAGLVPHFHGGRLAGRVRVMGVDPLRARPGEMGSHASLAFQDAEAQSVMATVSADVAFGPRCLGRPAAGIARIVDDALRAAGAAHLGGRSIATLSGGERQRAALAAVLAQQTPVLLLDEPTAQLDAEGAERLLRTVRARADASGTAVVIAEHRADRAAAVADRVVRLGGPAPPPAERAAGPEPGDVLARLADVTVCRGGAAVLTDAALELRAGRVTALIGGNGSGKTSLLRVLAGLDPPARGQVVLEGRDVTSLPAERRVPAVALVPQDPGRHLITERVADELEMGPRAAGVGRAERGARVDGALAAMDIAHLADRHPLDLSVGERERVAIAAAIALRPRVLVLDEPTRGMDPAARDRLAATARRLAADGVAVLIATHDPQLVAAACDGAYMLDGGACAPAEPTGRPA